MDQRKENWRVTCGDSLDVLKLYPDACFDSMISDPPAGISFMGKAWDNDKGGRDQWIAWLAAIMAEAFRTLKPGAHCLIWALPRTSSWTCRALEDAGFEVRDIITHNFGSGFPKNHDISLNIDKAAAAEREVIGEKLSPDGIPYSMRHGELSGRKSGISGARVPVSRASEMITAPATDAAKQWAGWGTAMKPSNEIWVLCRKPLDGTIVANVLAHGTGGLNIDACRVPGVAGKPTKIRPVRGKFNPVDDPDLGLVEPPEPHPAGRWPANTLLSHSASCAATCADSCPVAEMDRQSGDSSSSASVRGGTDAGHMTDRARVANFSPHNDTGGASRFFNTFRPDPFPFKYLAKPSTAERDAGLDSFATLSGGEATGRVDDSAGTKNPRAGAGRLGGRKNSHPTTKGHELMRWLCKLITPPGGQVLDPFAGSGTTGIACALEGFGFHGIELDSYHVDIARARISYIAGGAWEPMTEKATAETPSQGSLFE